MAQTATATVLHFPIVCDGQHAEVFCDVLGSGDGEVVFLCRHLQTLLRDRYFCLKFLHTTIPLTLLPPV